MSMPAPPAPQNVGAPNHTADHNTIAAILGGLQSAVGGLQGSPASFALAGGNTSVIPGTATNLATVSFSAVNRDGAPDILDFYYGSQKIFSLNSYGEPRITAAALTHVAEIIYVLSGQSADAWQVLSSALAVLARVGPDGSASFTGPVSRQLPGGPAGWVHCTLQSGWSTYSGRSLSAKLTNDNMVQLSGQIAPGTISDGILVATLPAGYAPRSRPEPVMVGQYHSIATGAGTSGAYLEVQLSGNVNLFSFGPYSNQGGAHLVVGGRFPIDAN